MPTCIGSRKVARGGCGGKSFAVGLRDTFDEPALATLRTSDATYLITGDKDLLAMAERYPIIGGNFVATTVADAVFGDATPEKIQPGYYIYHL